jgi:hypothetical protein
MYIMLSNPLAPAGQSLVTFPLLSRLSESIDVSLKLANFESLSH